MTSVAQPVSQKRAIAGYILTALVALFLGFDTTLKVLVLAPAVQGALLLTGYLGGAVASQLRVGAPLLSHTLFPIYVAALLWGGLYLREPRLRVAAVSPLASDGEST